MPSSLAALGLGTSRAVFLTSSSSPSRAASSSRARGSKLTLCGFLVEPWVLRLPFLAPGASVEAGQGARCSSPLSVSEAASSSCVPPSPSVRASCSSLASRSFCSSVGATEHLGWASCVGRCRGGLGTCLWAGGGVRTGSEGARGVPASRSSEAVSAWGWGLALAAGLGGTWGFGGTLGFGLARGSPTDEGAAAHDCSADAPLTGALQSVPTGETGWLDATTAGRSRTGIWVAEARGHGTTGLNAVARQLTAGGAAGVAGASCGVGAAGGSSGHGSGAGGLVCVSGGLGPGTVETVAATSGLFCFLGSGSGLSSGPCSWTPDTMHSGRGLRQNLVL
uniref:Putative lpxtg-motif cell wall anchor domain protein n=1 Tax=Ixodes ricinus TaxID=34613 RepID=A0A147BN75_IXORI